MTFLKEIVHFFLHLRLHYQFLLLSGGFLLGGLTSDHMNTVDYWLQFLNVHLFLFGGATAYNSYWDKDEGPIGGLKNPPEMKRWMHPLSIGLMFTGWGWSFLVGWTYFLIFGFSLILFWIYSTPHARWKGDPILSMFAIAISTGFNSVLLGHFAAGGSVNLNLMIAATGASLVLLSLYPISQIFQGEVDQKRGDRTFFLKYGIKDVKLFFRVSYLTGLIILSISLMVYYPVTGGFLLFTGLASYLILNRFIGKLKGVKEEYRMVMNIKFIASLSFVLFLLTANIIHHRWLGESILSNFF
jgi:4-hydroxybenzoate polyprenyltransferase